MTLVIRPSRFDELWPEVEILAARHFSEVNPGSRREFAINADLLRRMNASGHLIIIAAWWDGELIGYLTWSLVPDIESSSIVGDQGAWYVSPHHPIVARKMFDYSLQALRALGVKCVFPHHHLIGRGARLGRFFTKHGATPSKQVYELWIGDQ